MHTWLRSTYIALQLNPFIALAIVLPYVISQYVRTKSVNVCRCNYTYIFAMYFLSALFMTMLPFPDPNQLKPLTDWSEVLDLIPVRRFFLLEPGEWPMEVVSLLLNILMTVPLGFFLRTLFRFDGKKTALTGFLVSLLFETIQITGLLFVYPRPYRIFSTEDLIINTLGTMIGFALTPYVARYLPKPDDETNRRLEQGSEVAFLQRTIASAIDFVIISAATIAMIACVPPLHELLAVRDTLWRFPVFFILFLAVAMLYTSLFRGGLTLGYRVCGLRLITADGRPLARKTVMLRSLMIYVSDYSIPFWVLFFMTICTRYSGLLSVVWVAIGCMLMFLTSRNALEAMFNAVTRGASMHYDRRLKIYLTYNNSKKYSLFRIRVIDTRLMRESEVDALSMELCTVLQEAGFDRRTTEKARLMTEGLMLDWIGHGLRNMYCELRLDKGFRSDALILSVAGKNVLSHELRDSYVDMLSGLDLLMETYYAGGKNICIIHMEKENPAKKSGCRKRAD